jgi:type II secretory pathway pseudopilin PulG
LIELLVVIGIIAVLLAILVPIVSQVRLSAQTAATQAQLQKINTAITNYFNDFHGYPGLMHNLVLNPASTGDPPRVEVNMTQSEDLVLALLGGISFNPNKPLNDKDAFTYVPDRLGKGPVTCRPNLPPIAKNPYMTLKDSDLTPRNAAGDYMAADMESQLFMKTSAPPQQDSKAPEFVDQYSTPRPIIYIRANQNIPRGAAPQQNIITKKGNFNPNFAYNWDTFGIYMRPATVNGEAKADFLYKLNSTDNQTDQRFLDYFTGPDKFTPRNANGYLLISAGADRQFGTPDDIVFGSGGGQ